MLGDFMGNIDMIELFLSITKNFALLGVFGYLTAQLPIFRRTLNQKEAGVKDQLFLTLVFGIFSVLGNYLSIPILGSLANHRIVGVVVGGLFGGPWVGLGAGAIGAVSRYFLGGFTMTAAIISNIIIGICSGLVCRRYGPHNINLKIAMVTTLFAEFVLKAMVLSFSDPFSVAWDLEKIIALPTIITNVLGTGLFVYVIHDIYGEQVKAQARAAHQAMNVLRKTQGILYKGLNETTARQVAQIIYDDTFAAAVALTDTETVLAFVGEEADHHKAGLPIITEVTRRAIETEQTLIENQQGLGCPHPGCSLSSVIVTPLIVDKKVVGTLKLFKDKKGFITLSEAELIQGMADVLSLQMTQAKLNEQNILLGQAEFNVLKAQVHPHFLFNILGTISALTRTNVEKSRNVIKDLAGFLRKTLNREKEFVTLEEELDTVHMYLRLEQSRYGDRINLEEFIPYNLLQQMVPIFSLQPLVENAIRHGLSRKKGGGIIRIEAKQEDNIVSILIEDNGMGIPKDKLTTLLQKDAFTSSDGSTGIGIKNVHFRLQHLYGKNYGLTVESIEDKGTQVRMSLPYCTQDPDSENFTSINVYTSRKFLRNNNLQ